MNHYDAGDRVRLTGTFSDIYGEPADPSIVTAYVRDPDGVTTSPEPVHDSTGIYHADADVEVVGVWTYRFEGTGDVKAAEETMFAVDPTSFP